MEAKFIIKGSYIYNVKWNPSGTPPRCVYPRETVRCRISTIYFDHSEKIAKSIIYPRDLWYTLVEPYDKIEEVIINIKNFLPDWQEIEIIKK